MPGSHAPLPRHAPPHLQVTLAVVLNPTSPIGRKWRRLRLAAAEGALGSRSASPARRGGSGGLEGEDEEEGGAGYDTRLYSSHMSERQLAAEAERQRLARQQQLEEEGLSLEPYDAVRSTVRDRLLPSGTPPSAGAVRLTPPKRRLNLGGSGSPGGSPSQPGGGSPGGIEMAPLGGGPRSRGDLSPIAESLAESPRSSHSLA